MTLQEYKLVAKVGDRIESNAGYGVPIVQKYKATVISIDSDGFKVDREATFSLGWDVSFKNTQGYVELINEANNMNDNTMNAPEAAEAVLSADDLALQNAGFLDSELKLTLKTQKHLALMAFKANKKALVALAKAELKDKE